jgi:3-oxoacyl-[acyl-carrier protein] reductase
MNSRFPEAAALSPEDLRVGLTAQFEREITEADVVAFAILSGDANPLHVDPDYAARTNFGGRIVHGAFQVGLASALVGMHLPGRQVLLGTVQAKFLSPLYHPCRVRVSGEITAWNLASRAGTIRIAVQNLKSGTPTADVHMNFSCHEQREAAAARRPEPAALSGDDRGIVVVTGAGGGVGSEVAAGLAGEYTVLALVRRPGSPPAAGTRVIEVPADLQDASWRERLRERLQGRRIYGVVHAAWPGQPHGSLLQVDGAVVQQQLQFGAISTIELARFLFSQPEGGDAFPGGRLIVLGSIAATQKPVLALASYSLGKAAVEHTVRLLAPELARRRITINAISPSFIATGMNRQSTERQQMREAALVPLGRLCRTDDVVGIVRFLLSPEASFISGQVIGLTGAQL